MSQGNTNIKVRVESDLEARIKDAIASRNEVTQDVPDSISSWIRKACEMRLDHLERGRGKRAKGAGDGSESETEGRTEAPSEAAAQVQAG